MPADVECPPTPPELPREPTPTRVKLSPSREGSGSPGRASPDSACPICLGKLDNKAFSDGCMHQFCFTCIVEWSKVRAVCPLCKQAFTSIIHNVRSELDYDCYRLPPPAPPAEAQNPYIYQPGDGAEARSRWLQMRRQQYRYRSLVLPMLWPVPEGHEYHLPTAPARPRPPPRSRLTSDSRRRLYASDMWARPTPDELTGRYRETGPDFYRNNPACTHRLVPWLNRELNAVLVSPVHLARVMDQVMEEITRVHILSPEFRAQLLPYMTPWTEHFVHELYCYARSPYDMVGYDLHVQYRTGQPESPPAQVMASSASDSSGSDSDIRVLTPPPRVRTPMLVERLSSPEPEPGPSGSARGERGVCAALGRVRAFLASARAAEAASDSDNSGSESPVEVVEVLPPRQERAPEVVTLSSDAEPPPPPPAPKTHAAAAQTDAERRRAARRSRRAALLAEEGTAKRRRSPGEERLRARDGPEKRRRRDRAEDAAGNAADPAHKRKQGSSARPAKARDERAGERERQRAQRADGGRAAKVGQSCSSKPKSTASKSASSKSSGASGKRSNRERSCSIVSSTDIMTIEIIGDTTDRSSSHSNSRSRSVLSVAAETVDDGNAKLNGKSSDRSHKSKSGDRSHKSKSGDKSHKSKSSDKSHKSKHRDKSSKSKSSDKIKSKSSDKLKSKSSDKSSKSKSSDKHSSSSKSGKSRHNRDSAERRHKKRSRDESRRHKRSRLDGGSCSDEPRSATAAAALASPSSPQPSTSSGVTAHPRLFHRIVQAPSSASEAVSSSSSSVIGVPARLSRCRRLSGSSDGGGAADSDSGGEVVRPTVRSAVARPRRAASSDAGDSSDW